MSAKKRIGIIGTGGISHCHMKAYIDNSDRCEVVAACDLDEAKLTRFCNRYNIPAKYTDYNEMLAKENLDCVSVCTWNSQHMPATVAALKAGKNVLCEKPMALNAAEAKIMKDTAEETGKLLQIGFCRRFGNDAAVLKEMIDDGLFGDLYYSNVKCLRRSGCPGGWFGDKSRSGGGPLIDIGVHVIDLMRYLSGCPKPVSVFGSTYNNLGPNRAKGAAVAWDTELQEAPYTVEDFATAMVKFDNGLTLSLEAAFNINIKEDYTNVELFGTKAGCRVDPSVEFYTQYGGRFVNINPATLVTLDDDVSFNDEIVGFLDAVEGRAPCRATAEDGYVLMQIIDAVYESAKTGKLVEIEK
jgi:predicted dehydrogenase